MSVDTTTVGQDSRYPLIGMVLAEIANQAEKMDSYELRNRLKKQSAENRRELNNLLDKFIAGGGHFKFGSLTEAKGHQREIAVFGSLNENAPDCSNKDRLGPTGEILSKQGYQQGRDAWAYCRKIGRCFTRLIGWDVSKDTIITKLIQLKELRSNQKGTTYNVETSQTIFESVQQQNPQDSTTQKILVQYQRAKQDSVSYYARQIANLKLIQTESLKLIQNKEVQASTFCGDMSEFFEKIIPDLANEDLNDKDTKGQLSDKDSKKLCEETFNQVKAKLEELNKEYSKKLETVDKNQWDQKLKRTDIRNPDGTLMLEFKMGLTSDELDLLHLKKQIENYKLFKNFIHLIYKTFEPENEQDIKTPKRLMKEFIYKNFQGGLVHQLIHSLKCYNIQADGNRVFIRENIKLVLTDQIQQWSSNLTAKNTQLQNKLNELTEVLEIAEKDLQDITNLANKTLTKIGPRKRSSKAK